ncbi:histidine kinase 5 [Artemisia annua]|uniref:Histidine kinase 5 n=1 Tax=Artemisia annua TaxID=35608 RepID=A0A2U1M2L3_ARTAN|nr:histidine kinase 5 [Artemisia annua]
MKCFEECSEDVHSKNNDAFSIETHQIINCRGCFIGWDKDLRYRFIYNHFPSLGEEVTCSPSTFILLSCGGVKESQDFKREVLERGLPAKREITFETELFGAKTFLMYVEPVFSKDGEKLGVNHISMEITDQVKKRERMVKLREEIAVQKAKETCEFGAGEYGFEADRRRRAVVTGGSYKEDVFDV